jgi:hypothetical protein
MATSDRFRRAARALVARRWNIALACASTLVGIALFELGVRLVPVDYTLSPNWRYHAVLGWSQIPDASYDFVLDGRPVHVSFNSLGFRDVAHETAKPPGVKRIVVIGDSFSEAVQVNLEETFFKRLEELLDREGIESWEVINVGVGDFGTAQEYLALIHYGLAFDPDVIVHQIFPLNDICNNAIGLYGLCRSRNDRYRPYFVEVDGDLHQTSGRPLRTFLRRHVVTYAVLEYWLLEALDTSLPEDEEPDRPRRLRRAGFDGLDPLLYAFVGEEELPPAVAQGWTITERLIERIVQLSRRGGIDYLAMVVPFELRLQPSWDDFASVQPPPPMVRRHPEERLQRLFDRLDVPSVMLLDAFGPHLDEVLPYVGGHLSAAGHLRAGHALHRELVASGIAAPQEARTNP